MLEIMLIPSWQEQPERGSAYRLARYNTPAPQPTAKRQSRNDPRTSTAGPSHWKPSPIRHNAAVAPARNAQRLASDPLFAAAIDTTSNTPSWPRGAAWLSIV